MARKKSPLKAKEPIRLRFKALSNGNKSIYLDIYRDGKREYEFIKLYVVPEITPLDKIQNEQTIQAANAIKSQRILELTNNEAGIKQINKGKMLLADWMQRYYNLQHARSETRQQRIIKTSELLKQYAGVKIRLKDIDKEFCAGFVDWLQNGYLSIRGDITNKRIRNEQTADNSQPKRIKAITARNYFYTFNSALNEAVRQGVIDNNPCQLLNQVDKIKVPESKRTYLTIEEVRRLIDTDFPQHPEIKQAFLFSCFCGLRISDVLRIEWKDVITDGKKIRLSIVMKKTKAPLYLPLSKQAIHYLPSRNGAADGARLFKFSEFTVNYKLKKWVEMAGITNKNVTFHTSRHTFATTLLTKGADLYTVSKLLGHSEIGTTQIYAKIIDKKKDEAVNLLDNIF